MSEYTRLDAWYVPLDHGLFRTTAEVRWHIGRDGSQLVFSVPAGIEFDVSVPRGLRWLFDPHDERYLKAAALHDWALLDDWSRVAAGAVFHDALKASGVGRLRRLAMWLAVSLWKFD